ncbi:hypothetical protein NP493_802g03046 [Ridgeia piscesae]|uniref:Uncharacterized protein n=1 Tax=Ridgeia piscesae TaxID=27915 RepID=A0AAD9KPS2_RIDPI|nr:hypothetical protein NP493_802g03046 [Ridgeia piscesae]
MAELGKKASVDKEVKAFAANVKEDRLLQKSLETLRLEESFSMKLLQLDYKQLRLDQKRLRTRINKIRSYLRPDEIVQLRALELDGKLEQLCHSVHVSSTIQIAAAAKRLKLGAGMTRPRTAHPTIGVTDTTTPLTPTRTARTASTPQGTSRVGSAVSFRIIAPDATGPARSGRGAKRHCGPRPLTSVGPDRNRLTIPERPSRPKTATGVGVYSSHNIEKNDIRAAQGARRSSQTPPTGGMLNFRKSSGMSMDSVEMTMALARKQETRQELIETEHRVGYVLDTQRRRFIDRVTQFVEETNRFASEEPQAEIPELETIAVANEAARKRDVGTSTLRLKSPATCTSGTQITVPTKSAFHF